MTASERLNYVWRILATGFCFAAFGLGGLCLRIVVFPAITLVSPSSEVRSRRVRLTIHHSFRLFVRLTHGSGAIGHRFYGERELGGPGTLILANHPTLMDVVYLISLAKNANCIVKYSLWNNPFIGGVMRSAGYISNVDSQEMLGSCVDRLNSGDTVIMFPEGTRTDPGRQLRFLRGAAHIAIAANCDLLPVIIECEPPTLTKSDKWYQVPPYKALVTLRVQQPLNIDAFRADDDTTISVRRLTQELQIFFEDRIGNELD